MKITIEHDEKTQIIDGVENLILLGVRAEVDAIGRKCAIPIELFMPDRSLLQAVLQLLAEVEHLREKNTQAIASAMLDDRRQVAAIRRSLSGNGPALKFPGAP